MGTKPLTLSSAANRRNACSGRVSVGGAPGGGQGDVVGGAICRAVKGGHVCVQGLVSILQAAGVGTCT